MFNKLIFVCILSLALTSSISGIRQKRKVFDDIEPNEDPKMISKDDTIKRLEKENSEYKERLRQYEINNCLKYQNSSDFYIVNVPGIDPFEAPCESRLKNGGWTVIQRRLDGSVNFDRNWNEYRNGFGDLKGEFFIGLEKLYRITAAQPQELLIYYETSSYQTDHERCSNFLIGSEREEYVVKRADFMYAYGLESILEKKFTTFDRDNDEYWWGNCAKEFKGGWWFGACHKEDYFGFKNLNGPLLPQHSSSLKSVQIMIRPKE